MRIAFDVGPVRARPTGVGVYARSLATALAQQQPSGDLRLIGRRPDAEELPRVPSLGRDRRLPYPAWAMLKGGIDARRAGSDVVHFTDGLVPLVRQGPTVVTVHDLSIVREWRTHAARRWPRIPFVLASPHLADRVIADSTATADELMALAKLPAGRIDVVPLAPRPGAGPSSQAAVETALERHGLAGHRFVLAPGTIEPRKNHVRLIQAFTRLVLQRQIDDDLLLVLAGAEGWNAASALEAMSTSPAATRIRRLGWVADDELNALYTGAAAVAYVSTYEGFGLPILEAMAAGTPVVTSNVSSMPEAAGDAAVLVDPLDVRAIARGLVDVLEDRADRVTASRAHVRAFDWQRTAQLTRLVYEAVTTSAGRARGG